MKNSDRKLKILLLVSEPLRYDCAGGNVVINLFSGLDAEFAQVYMDARSPLNPLDCRYYQITRGEIVRKFLTHSKVGKILKDNTIPELDLAAQKEDRFFAFFKLHRLPIFWSINCLLWFFSNWRTPQLEQFILDFKPDCVFAPCYASPFMLKLTRYVKKLTGVPFITYSADDNYSLRQFSFSPIFWLQRFWVRFEMRKTFPFYDRFYSMSEDEIHEMESIVGMPMSILRKGGIFQNISIRSTANQPIKLIYAGGIYINRWKILSAIGDAIRLLNQSCGEKKMELHIYTAYPSNARQKRRLNDNENIFLHSAVDLATLKQKYQESDIALHVESLDIKNRLITRLSFSTKIIDCLAGGCAVMVIAWNEHTGYRYLYENDAAICIDSLGKIPVILRQITDHPELIAEYAAKANALLKKNHDLHNVQAAFYQDIQALLPPLNASK